MIAAIAVSLLAVTGFGVTLWRLRIVPVARKPLTTAMAGVSAMMDSELDDAAKEIALRRAGLGLIGVSFGLLWRGLAAFAAATAPIVTADQLGLVAADAVIALMLRPDYIVILSVLGIGLGEILRRRTTDADSAGSATARYSTTDRFFHSLAFSGPFVQTAVSRVEDRLFARAVQTPARTPVFVTSLARGGTTALLNALYDSPGIATHTYRDMPFVTAPILWNRLSGGSRRGAEPHQRAHGDGLEINLDSPEAFEEVIWKLYWPEKFQGATIGLWDAEDHKADAAEFLTRHMAKVVRARTGGGAPAVRRYCSKNNANIARLPYLLDRFPGCHIVVPVRRPEAHAASLLRQHQNFLHQQAGDDFIRRYMRDIGHFEFGLLHRPIGFPGFDPAQYDPATPEYWMAYWIHAFRHVLTHRNSCIFILQDDLRRDPERIMRALYRQLDLPQGPSPFASYFHATPDHAPDDLYDPGLCREANRIYDRLASLASARMT